MADVYVSQAWLEVAPATVVRSGDAAQTVGDFAQTAAGQVIAAAQVEVSWVALALPGGLATLNIEGAQQVGDFEQVAQMFDPVGTIDGGGTITEGYPHRSVVAAQTVGEFEQAASMSDAGVTLAQAAQQIGDFTQSAVADSRANASAAQQVEPFTQYAMIGDPPAPPAPVTGGGGWGKGGKYRTRVGSRVFEANTFADLRAKVLAYEAQQEADNERRNRPKRVARGEPVPIDPAQAARAEMGAQMAAFQQQMLDMHAQAMQGQQALAKQYEDRLLSAETTVRSAMALAQKARADADALAALLTN
jgi:hypothetical protein